MHHDIIIIGSGIVGSTIALALSQKTKLKIALLESQTQLSTWQPEQHDFRVSAISFSSKNIFQMINVWDAIQAKRLSPYTKMHVWDEGSHGEIHFDCRDVQKSVLGYIIEDSVMRASLQQKIIETASINFIHPIKLNSLRKNSDHIELMTQDEKIFSAKLIIAADGANSWVREAAHFDLKNEDYAQTAIVATVKTTLPHQQTAWQRFLTTGPLAFLPLDDEKTCSIVWSATHEKANELLALSDENFCEQLSEAFEDKLGKTIQTSRRYHFPLRMRHAKNYVQENVALVGDAAHTIHPLAGQGVNMGLLDALCLVDVITEAVNKQRDFASLAILKKYDRARKADNLNLLAGVGFLNQLFLNQNATIKNLRSTGLGFVNRFQPIKNLFVRYALGER